VEKKGTSRNNADPKALRKLRDMNVLPLQKKRPSRKKEEMFTWILQGHMKIMRHGWLTHMHIFI
jgi:hypothetical protein